MSTASNARRTGDKPFTASVTLPAPRERVWKAWTDRDELNRWFGPTGCTVVASTLALKPGGTYHYCLRTPDGRDMWGKWTFREIVAPSRLVLISCFSDAQGGITRHPLSHTWPQQTLSTTTLLAQDTSTVLTISWVPFEATEEEHRTFDGAHAGMQQGWNGTFQQLRTYLERT